jgi:nitrogen regulatory protein PII-like uncharacterized protein
VESGMTSAWGASFGAARASAWGNSWGSITTLNFSGGHFYEFWRKKWAKQWETKTPDIEEVIEFIEEEPEQAIEVAATVSPKYASIQPETLKINEKLAENIAKQIIVAIKIQQIKIAQEEEDIETLLLIA